MMRLSNTLLNIGLENMVAKSEIVAIARPDSLPVKQLIQTANQDHKLIDLTRGRKRRSVIVTRSGFVIISPLRTPTLDDRYMATNCPDRHTPPNEPLSET